jgi:hypothetical protein
MLGLQQAFMPFFSYFGWNWRIILLSAPNYPTQLCRGKYYPLPLKEFLGTLGALSFAEMKSIALKGAVSIASESLR